MLIVVMGASGASESVGTALAARLGLPCYDADAFQTAENRAKLARGEVLGDGDCWPWLEALAASVPRWEAAGGAVLTSGVLKLAYRDVLLKNASASSVVCLGPEEGSAGAQIMPPSLRAEEVVERLRLARVAEGEALRGVVHFAEGGLDADIGAERSAELLDSMLARLGPLRRVLLLPPDGTRRHSGAGEITSFLYQRLAARAEVEVLPALGTHVAMSEAEIAEMFPGIPLSAFRVHDFRKGLRQLGEVPASFVEHVSEGLVSYPVRCAVNARLIEGRFDRIISIGQLVPHEVVGIANHNKNVFVGVGGKDIIDRTHFIGAAYGMERMMGRAQTPVRAVLDYMAGQFARDLPITYVLTVRQRDSDGVMHTRGLYAGDDEACFHAGVPLVQRVNLELLEAPLKKVVVYLDPAEFKSTWLGNKAIYRTRLAIADGGELVIVAPGVKSFGEDAGIDRLIRKHGYRGTERTLERVKSDPDLGESLSAAAHLIHGSSEGRFRIRYATGGLQRSEVEDAGYEYGDCAELCRRYDPARLRDGMNRLPDGDEFFYVSNPALGLWGLRANFPRF